MHTFRLSDYRDGAASSRIVLQAMVVLRWRDNALAREFLGPGRGGRHRPLSVL